MHSLSAEVFDTRMDLDGAEIDGPQRILRDRAIERAGLERDLGPDLGIGL